VALIVLAVVVGALIGLALPPAARHRARPRAHLLPLLIVGVVAQATAGRLDGGQAVVVALAGFACLLAFALANLHLTGMGVLAIGLAANVFVIAINGGMPVRTRALVAANVIDEREIAGLELSGPRHPERSSDRLVELGDIIPVPPIHEVVSFGDLIIVVATADVVAHLVRRRRGRRASPPPGSGLHEEREAGPGLGDGTEARGVVRVPVLGEP
jgi:hypothetical protein